LKAVELDSKNLGWAFRTHNPEFLTISGSTAEQIYDRRRAWLEASFLGYCNELLADDASRARRWQTRTDRDKRGAVLKRRRDGSGFGSVAALVERVSWNWAPPESHGFVGFLSQFLSDALYSYADKLMGASLPRVRVISEFLVHADDLRRDALERRWAVWRERLDYPESETGHCQAMLTSVADRVTAEVEARVWNTSAAQHATGITPNDRISRIARLASHIKSTKVSGVGFSSKAAFYRALKVDRADYGRWERGQSRSENISAKIEQAIDELP
jgi:hypothetical protein